MIKYLNGTIITDLVLNEKILNIRISETEGTPLKENLQEIMNEYKKYIGVFCLLGDVEDIYELASIFSITRKFGLKNYLKTGRSELSQIGQNVLNELNYIRLNDVVMKKEYSPFGDSEVWIEA